MITANSSVASFGRRSSSKVKPIISYSGKANGVLWTKTVEGIRNAQAFGVCKDKLWLFADICLLNNLRDFAYYTLKCILLDYCGKL
jgi:hypothetical protein